PALLRVLRSFPTRRSSDLEREAQHLTIVGTQTTKRRCDELAPLRRRLVGRRGQLGLIGQRLQPRFAGARAQIVIDDVARAPANRDRKSTRLNSSHVSISYA